ncbi:P-loop containing nucleoside triphosphate hydrolase protein [Catenaria anguillulae PL171]|uniref:p-loop containing nucleoside triphosphate hydrolase protein n=1 Tax=Catenaria anguillulae PL171 TaxID=765915 RepID=A0A1Y2HP24_9FUNG|nr:P-loop containing nucleoside triphosphate hydrolase protein [Catenaria anguillulae PL171]
MFFSHGAKWRPYSSSARPGLDPNLPHPQLLHHCPHDHGKSTLADRLLELTRTIRHDRLRPNKQVLDKLQVERDRGITVKAQTVSMVHRRNGQTYLLNLIDTPGHVDFSYEVSRSLAACQGALLLVDAAQGIQAQTVANFYLAFGLDLAIVPVLNKVDLPAADPERVKEQIATAFELPVDNMLQISGKTGLNCEQVLDAVVSCHSGKRYEVVDVGIMHPDQRSTGALYPGQVGYAVLGMKSTSEAHVGDTFHLMHHRVEALPGFQPAKPCKLVINDASVSVMKETSASLGQGFRLGFLGTLHMDVFRQRLESEYQANVICTAPTVPFKVTYQGGRELVVRNPVEFPEGAEYALVKKVEEPMIAATIITPDEYLGKILELCGERRGEQREVTYIDSRRVMLKYTLPMTEVVSDFYDQLKSRSSGFASFDYEECGYEPADLVKLNINLNGKPVDALASIRHRSAVEQVARETVAKLKGVLERQLYEIVIQGCVGGKVLARETLAAMRKNQKEGKKRMKMVGNVEISQEAFLTMMKK